MIPSKERFLSLWSDLAEIVPSSAIPLVLQITGGIHAPGCRCSSSMVSRSVDFTDPACGIVRAEIAFTLGKKSIPR